MHKLIITAFTAVLLAGGAAQAKEWTKIRIGVEGAYPPFSSMTEDGELQGFDIDIAHALCAQINAECTLVPQDWDGIIPALLARKYDAIIASMSITEERKKKVNFTNKYYQTPARFARRKGSGIEVSAADLKGRKVGVQRATIHDGFLTEVFGDEVEVVRYGSQDEAYLDAVSGRLDLLMADSVALMDGFLNTEQGGDWEFVGPPYTDVKYFGEGAGIAVRKRDNDLREQLNAAIDAIRANGVYRQINEKYFDFDIYGN
ncbi:MAG: ABC transporter substrate-binding protein [Gammaproteobacteria bacterium]|nr:ABC transporter substrate-binding protein [Gammaproteobacteria bacterium]MDD9800190.1 ABC transporter substrate-binding protein [Gammaproteobacteria bacterium]MDD9816059.1 ABC transporter substrate-binding protein [Gammaproteobacteria bacterium]MDD9852109.1 ABC transporter substrate-binding protein [Gammaproteobacteria bacterium]MDD9870536.1 ABC transporter substrate-binding protein [Gammaproteobacteria bacterium]